MDLYTHDTEWVFIPKFSLGTSDGYYEDHAKVLEQSQVDEWQKFLEHDLNLSYLRFILQNLKILLEALITRVSMSIMITINMTSEGLFRQN